MTLETNLNGQAPTDDVVRHLQVKIDEVLGPYTKGLSRFALLDAPDYPNVGDSAIYLGTRRYFELKHGRSPAFVCTNQECHWDELDRLDPAAPIFLQGGGNFGDIWPWFQDFREAVLDRYPERTVVQLPQTIQFADPGRIEQASRIIGKHGRFVLLVRDEASLAFAFRHFDCRVELCPDMAFYLGSVPRIGAARHDLLLLLRDDKERSEARAQDRKTDWPAGTRVADWITDPKWFRRSVKARTLLAEMVRGRFGYSATFRHRFIDRLAEGRLKRGVTLLSSARTVVSDRLHAHIMCTLMGVPHVVLDNSYGKISGFRTAWTMPVPFARSASTLSEAVKLSQDLGGSGEPAG